MDADLGELPPSFRSRFTLTTHNNPAIAIRGLDGHASPAALEGDQQLCYLALDTRHLSMPLSTCDEGEAHCMSHLFTHSFAHTLPCSRRPTSSASSGPTRFSSWTCCSPSTLTASSSWTATRLCAPTWASCTTWTSRCGKVWGLVWGRCGDKGKQGSTASCMPIPHVLGLSSCLHLTVV